MRQPVYLGLRMDKRVEEVNIEKTGSKGKFGKEAPKSTDNEEELVINKKKVTVKNLGKVFWPAEGYTKGNLVEYYREISHLILPYLKDRPQSLLRYPDGITGESFYHKDIDFAPDWVKTIEIKSEEKKVNYLLCQDEATLIYMINLGCIDLNPWNSRIGTLDKPDYLIMDLDPEQIGFDKVVETALAFKEVLEEAGIEGYPKTSGAKGIHIYIPLGARYDYDQVRQFSQILADRVNVKLPKITSTVRSPKERKGRVYLDCLQNARGQTLASVYSVRAKPMATVSTPLEWNELDKKLTPQMFTIKNILDRLKKKGDLFKNVLGRGVDMQKALRKLEG